MKTIPNTSLLLILFISMTATGCWWPTFPQTDPPPHYVIKQQDFFKDNKASEETPFKLKDPNIHAPLLSHKGEVNVDMNLINGIGIHTAIAVGKKLAIEASGSIVSTNHKSVNSKMVEMTRFTSINGEYDSSRVIRNLKYGLEHKLSETSVQVAVGHFQAFEKYGRFEYFAGFAYGHVENEYTYNINTGLDQSFASLEPSYYSFTETRNFFQTFIQENFGYVTPHTEGALIARLSRVRFTDRKMVKSYPISESKMQSDNLVLQPALKFGAGGKRIRGFLQVGWNIPLGKSEHAWTGTNVQSGILFRL